MPETTGYPEIAEHFRQQIREGVLKPGDTMPSFKAAGEQFGVAHTTVNRAYRVLKMEGLTLAKPGVGTVVAAPASSALDGDKSTRQEALQMSRDLIEFIEGERQLAEVAQKYVQSAHLLYEEASGLADDDVARETCLNLAYTYSVLARRAAERLEQASK